MQPLVSVVLSYFRQADYLQDAVRSVLDQSYPHFEIVVVDDCCPDAPASEILRCFEDSRLRVLRHDGNLGLSATRNSGVANATGSYILPLNADDLLAADCLKIMVPLLDKTGSAALFSRVQYFGAEDGNWLPRLALPDSLFEGTPTTFLYRKDVFDQIGGYDARSRNAPDKAFVISMMLAGYEIESVDQPLYLRRKYSGKSSYGSAGAEIMKCALAVHRDLYEENLAALVAIGAAAWWREALRLEQVKTDLQELETLKASYIELEGVYGLNQ